MIIGNSINRTGGTDISRVTGKISRPTMLIVHATKNHDPLKIAKNGIDNTVYFLREKMNILEIVPPECSIESSYTELDKSHKGKSAPFLFNKDFVDTYRSYLDGVNDFILAGRAMRHCFTTALISLILLKACHFNKDMIQLFKGVKGIYVGDEELYEKAKDNLESISKLNIENGGVLNIHFNSKAIYSDYRDTNLIDYGIRGEEYPLNLEEDWDEIPTLTPDYKNMIHLLVFAKLPKFIENLFAGCKLNIHEFIDGVDDSRPVYAGLDRAHEINMYYWFSVEGLVKYFRSGNE